jgi:hypothetical protein
MDVVQKLSAEDFCERFNDIFAQPDLACLFFTRKIVYYREFRLFERDRFGASIASNVPASASPVFLVRSGATSRMHRLKS